MFQMILEKASKFDLIERYASLTINDIIQQKCPSIGSLERIHGKEATSKVMSVIIADLSSTFQGDLNIEEIQEVVTEIRSGFSRNISLEGLYIISSQLKRSKTYKLRINNILKAIDDHIEEYSKAVTKANYNHHLQFKFNEPDRQSDEASSTSEKFSQFQAEYFKRSLKKTTDNAQ